MKMVIMVGDDFLIDLKEFSYIRVISQGDGHVIVGFNEPGPDDAANVDTALAFYFGEGTKERAMADLDLIFSAIRLGAPAIRLAKASRLSLEEIEALVKPPRKMEQGILPVATDYKPTVVRVKVGDPTLGNSTPSQLAAIRGHRIADVQFGPDGLVAIITGEVSVT